MDDSRGRRIGDHGAVSSLRIVGLYAGFSAAWILFSDSALYYLVRDQTLAAAVATAKGWVFVLVTSVLLLGLVSRELSQRTRLEDELRSRIAEKELLLREVHHRVNNNLQIVASILGMERELLETEPDRAIMEATRERVIAMGLVHEELCRIGDLSRIDLGAWVGEMAMTLADSLDAAHLLRLELEPVIIDLDRALPCGLLLAEGLSNAVRFGGGTPIRIRLSLLPGGRGELEVRDGGPGFGAPGALSRTGGIGLLLSEALAAQTGGRLERRSEAGAVFSLNFPVSRDLPQNPA